MARKKKKKKKEEENFEDEKSSQLHPEARRSVWTVILLGVAIILILAAVGQAGPWGNKFYAVFHKLFGIGYYFLPTASVMIAFSFVSPEERKMFGVTLAGGLVFILSGLGFLDIISSGRGGLTGTILGAIEKPFGTPTSLVIMGTFLVASLIVTINRPLKVSRLVQLTKLTTKKKEEDKIEIKVPQESLAGALKESDRETSEKEIEKENDEGGKEKEPEIVEQEALPKSKLGTKPTNLKNYIAPPPSLLVSSVEKPTIGDLRTHANTVKRTLESFGIPVEMGEINVGPTVTRYTLKPAEGVKLTRITTLHQDLALALAAHPIRIEAPIPGKSLVGLEVPNKSTAIVRLGSLILYPEFQKSSPLTFALGRNVNGEPVFADIGKMPHLLIAGSTGSGKSISLHALLTSLLYKNSPDMLRLILVDPKRVELTVYNGIPHLLAPVITENKKAMGALRWAIQEMDRRYQILMEAGSRDITSYNKKKKTEKLPYILITIDELADLMASYGREVEGAIIRLAQMARATGIHLVVSTQRPSVEVITGLIKANITSRVALQVASQIDSRTILDSAGAEKLLGRGDLLFISSEFSKPRRIQGGYIDEAEVKKVVDFIKSNNQSPEEDNEDEEESGESLEMKSLGEKDTDKDAVDFDDFSGSDDEEDELYEEAVETVRAAQKASASLLQRRLRVGYARAARLLDMMEERGVVGSAEGSKPREVLM